MTSQNSLADLAEQRRKELGDALIALAMRMLENGADAEFVQKFIDDECERMRRIQREIHE